MRAWTLWASLCSLGCARSGSAPPDLAAYLPADATWVVRVDGAALAPATRAALREQLSAWPAHEQCLARGVIAAHTAWIAGQPASSVIVIDRDPGCPAYSQIARGVWLAGAVRAIDRADPSTPSTNAGWRTRVPAAIDVPDGTAAASGAGGGGPDPASASGRMRSWQLRAGLRADRVVVDLRVDGPSAAGPEVGLPPWLAATASWAWETVGPSAHAHATLTLDQFASGLSSGVLAPSSAPGAAAPTAGSCVDDRRVRCPGAGQFVLVGVSADALWQALRGSFAARDGGQGLARGPLLEVAANSLPELLQLQTGEVLFAIDGRAVDRAAARGFADDQVVLSVRDVRGGDRTVSVRLAPAE